MKEASEQYKDEKADWKQWFPFVGVFIARKDARDMKSSMVNYDPKRAIYKVYDVYQGICVGFGVGSVGAGLFKCLDFLIDRLF